MSRYSRREFLRALAASSAGVIFVACRAPSRMVTITPAAPVGTAPASARPQATVTPVGDLVWAPPTEPRITPNDDFYTMKYHPTPPPEVDLASYRLQIAGEVDTPLSLSMAEIQALPGVTLQRTLECISNPVGGRLIGNAFWRGVSMGAVLEMAGIRSSSHHLRLESLDGYHTGIPVSLAQDPESYLVYEMNGEPLPAKHGYPLRALWPGRYGQKQPKWIERITVQRQPHTGYFEGQGWSDAAIIRPNARIEQPPPRAVQQAPFYVAGIGFTTDAGVEKIEVTLDDGLSWQEAALLEPPSPLVWTHWWLEVAALETGVHRVLARVTDRRGETQTRPERNSTLLGDPFPDGTAEMHRVVVQVGSEGAGS